MSFIIKRIYEPVAASDDQRILIDHLWPRGISKEKAQLTAWFKEVSPSPQLRTWFAHDPTKFVEFRTKYLTELKNDPLKQPELQQLLELGRQHQVTLLYAAHNPQVNHALVLQEFLQNRSLTTTR